MGDQHRLLWRPALLGRARLRYVLARADVDATLAIARLCDLDGDWGSSVECPVEPLSAPPAHGDHEVLAVGFGSDLEAWRAALAAHLAETEVRDLWSCPALKAYARPGEGKAGFAARVRQLHREARDVNQAKLSARYAPRLRNLQEQVARAEAKLEREQGQLQEQQVEAAVAIGGTLLGAMLGHKTARKAGTAARRGAKAAKEARDVKAAEKALAAAREALLSLDAEYQAACERDRNHPPPLEPVALRPRKGDLEASVMLVWTPWRAGPDGSLTPLRAGT